jgi:hypothetical protein
VKRVILLLTLAVFVLSFTLAVAQQKPAAPAADTVKCCVKAGDCKDMPKADCEKAKGKVVKDCKECK